MNHHSVAASFVLLRTDVPSIVATGDVPVCDLRKFYECAVPTKSNYVKSNEAEKCNCRRQCRQLIYTPTMSQSLLADSVAKRIKRAYRLKEHTLDDVKREHLILEVGILAGFV